MFLWCLTNGYKQNQKLFDSHNYWLKKCEFVIIHSSKDIYSLNQIFVQMIDFQ